MIKNTKLINLLIISSFLLIYINPVFSNENDDLENALKEPIKPEVTVASKSELTIKKSPGIITLITEDQIRNSGVRTLQEALELIPGIAFNLDTEGVVGISIRGLWAHEGKVLVNIDGQEINDSLWLTVLFGNHIQTDQIKRIEVLRGPGSAIYGRNAEFAVVNIITKSAEDLNGFAFKSSLGGLKDDILNSYTKRNLSLSYGQKFGDFSIVAHGLVGLGNTSDKLFTDFYNNIYPMKNNQKENPTYLNLGIAFKDFSARFISDIYRRTSVDLFNLTLPKESTPLNMIHDAYLGEIKYNFKISDSLVITPKINYRKYYPWVSNTESDKKLSENKDYSAVFFNKSSETYLANINANYDLNDNFNFILGSDYFYDIGKAEDQESSNFGAKRDLSSVSYNNLSLFGQGLYKNEFITLAVGSRYENHSAYGSFFIPRASLSTTLGDFHSKLLFNKAFRSPSIININYFNNKFSKFSQIKPENTTVLELEFGYDITENLSFNINAFDIGVDNPIIYFYDEDKKDDSYDNFQKTGTRGFEFELNYINKKVGSANLAYSFYTPNNNKVDVYEVPNNTNYLIGAPAHKFNFSSSLNLNENISINPSLILYGSRFAYSEIQKKDDKEESIIKEFPSTLMLNLNLLYKDFIVKDLNLSLTGFNLLNQKDYYFQQYNGGHAPLEKPSTEFSLNIEYKLPLFKNLGIN